MKYIFLVWSGMWRKRTRAALILLQVIVAFTLFGVLQGLDTGIKEAISRTHADRMYVTSRVSGGGGYGDLLLSAQISQIERVPGVVAVMSETGLGGIYQNLNQQVAVQGVDAASFARIFPEVVIQRGAVDALVRTRTGAIVGEQLVRRYGWKVGERIPIQSPLTRRDGSSVWTFDIVGTFSEPDNPDQANYLIANYAYLNEARAANRDTVNDFIVQINDPKRSASVGHQIDQLFDNSPHETRTMTEANMVSNQVQRIGDIGFLTHAVTAAAFFALLFATGTLMMQTIRERTPELAVLKTVGFADGRVMSLILAEALLSCLLGAALGLGIAALLLPRARSFIGPLAYLPRIVIVAGIACAIVLALLSGAIPAWRGMKLQVATALSRR